ncbi:MAG TPA: DUF3343 domain-containing protein [Candidatus Ornithospirochaeta avicola]|uniref:DUF3343 domain-containing protein n=1 Tax=Candidatus Ornithospirochaeta avicola TaxID=2840896 RepID=A0A9D1TN04_9SPIO|nr:DUF3343 domain-containing protein [Candidatus Ornithospirochaeta avicola]
MASYDQRTVLTFTSHYQTLKAELKAKELFLQARIIPTPREISSSCQSALLIASSDYQRLKNSIKAEGVFSFRDGKWYSLQN